MSLGLIYMRGRLGCLPRQVLQLGPLLAILEFGSLQVLILRMLLALGWLIWQLHLLGIVHIWLGLNVNSLLRRQ